jgi:hypothetical protein
MALCSLSIGSSCAPLARPRRGERRRQSGSPDDRSHDRIDFGPRDNFGQRFRSGQHSRRQAVAPQPLLQTACGHWVREHRVSRREAPALGQQALILRVGRQCDHLETLGMPPDYVERARADGAGGAEDRETLPRAVEAY